MIFATTAVIAIGIAAGIAIKKTSYTVFRVVTEDPPKAAQISDIEKLANHIVNELKSYTNQEKEMLPADVEQMQKLFKALMPENWGSDDSYLGKTYAEPFLISLGTLLEWEMKRPSPDYTTTLISLVRKLQQKTTEYILSGGEVYKGYQMGFDVERYQKLLAERLQNAITEADNESIKQISKKPSHHKNGLMRNLGMRIEINRKGGE